MVFGELIKSILASKPAPTSKPFEHLDQSAKKYLRESPIPGIEKYLEVFFSKAQGMLRAEYAHTLPRLVLYGRSRESNYYPQYLFIEVLKAPSAEQLNLFEHYCFIDLKTGNIHLSDFLGDKPRSKKHPYHYARPLTHQVAISGSILSDDYGLSSVGPLGAIFKAKAGTELPNNVGWIYVITNKGMSHLVKVGYTMRNPVQRAKELNNTGIPHGYEVAFKMQVRNPYQIEQTVHKNLAILNEGKEWFRCSVEEAVDAIRIAIAQEK